MTGLRKLLANLGLVPVAKSDSPLIRRADRALSNVHTIKIEVIRKPDRVTDDYQKQDRALLRNPR